MPIVKIFFRQSEGGKDRHDRSAVHDECGALPVAESVREIAESLDAARAEGERLLSVRKRKRSVRVYPRLIVGIVKKFRVIFPLEIPEIAFAKTVDDELLCVRV